MSDQHEALMDEAYPDGVRDHNLYLRQAWERWKMTPEEREVVEAAVREYYRSVEAVL